MRQFIHVCQQLRHRNNDRRLMTKNAAARVWDIHTCPVVSGSVPHSGGPIMPPGCPTVLIGGVPAARAGDLAACNGPPDSIVSGSATVHIGGQPAARLGDKSSHGGTITAGCSTVLIGD
jgi:uncharacterized Zn-binding protein involved in type VI secretion